MPSLDALLGDTLFFTADAGNAEFSAQPIDSSVTVFRPPPPPAAPVLGPDDQAIWSWTHDMTDPAAVTSVTANVRSMLHDNAGSPERPLGAG